MNETMKEKTMACLLVAILFASLTIVGMAVITSSVDVTVLKDDVGVQNASVQVDGQYRGVTGLGGYLYIPDLSLGYHTVSAQYIDNYNSGKYVGDSGFEINSGFVIQPGDTIARVNLKRSTR